MTAALEISILTKVIAVLQGMVCLRHRQVTAEMRFAEDLDLDSLDVMDVALHIEKVFDVEFPLEVIATFRSLTDVVRYLSSRYFPEATQFASELAQGDSVLSVSGDP